MNKSKYIYWDYNSTTPCAPEVVAEMLPTFANYFGNASSTHPIGRIASSYVEKAREDVAKAMGTYSANIIFTSGATESNNLILLGMARNRKDRRKIIISAVEHKSILEPAKKLSEEGCELIVLPVDRNGVVKLEAADEVIDQNTLIVSVQGANNETGVLQPVREIARLAHERGAFCHCDAAQIFGKVPINVADLGVDAASFSGHKVYGPKGVGALYLSDNLLDNVINPICYGGGQEKQLRPGTINVPAIIGFASACRLFSIGLAAESELISNLREKCEEMLLASIEGSSINGRTVPRLPGTISLTLPNIPADMLVANLKSVCVSVGSACNSGVPEPSHVLLAMNMDKEHAESTLRISLGRYTTEDEIAVGCNEIIMAAKQLINKLNA